MSNATKGLPTGWVWTSYRGKEVVGGTSGETFLTIKDTKGRDKVIKNPRLAVPVTEEAILNCCEKYTRVIKDIDGKEHRIPSGSLSCVVAQFWFAAEAVIGLGRTTVTKKGVKPGLSAEEVAGKLASMRSFGDGSVTAKLTEEEIDLADVEQLRALIRARGLVARKPVTTVEEDEGDEDGGDED